METKDGIQDQDHEDVDFQSKINCDEIQHLVMSDGTQNNLTLMVKKKTKTRTMC
jgi:hypothetical protein